MKDVQDGLGLKNIPHLVRKKMCGKFETKDLTEERKNKCIKSEYQITENYYGISYYNYYAKSD